MAERVVLHVGTMKSGTSYLQALLFAQQARLADGGVLVPGETWTDQVRAVRQAVSTGPRRPRPAWSGLCDRVAGHRGTAVVSMEYLGPTAPKTAARLVQEIGGRDARVEVVLTARDLNRTIVSMWQETVQNGRSWRWEDYRAAVHRGVPGTGRGVADRTSAVGTFWRQQHLLRMVRDWSEVVGADRVGLVTLPPPGADRSLLPRRFAEAAGLDLDVGAPVPVANESLGLASLLVLRRLNELLDEAGLRFPAGSALRKRVLAKQVLAARRADEPSLGLPVEDWVVEQTAATVGALKQEGVRLVGEWADLDPVAVPGVTPDDVDAAAVADAALAGLAGLVLARSRRTA
jgi:hypothetical protein